MKTTLLAALAAAAIIALPAAGQTTAKETARLEAGPAKEAKSPTDAKATPKDRAKLAKVQGNKSKKPRKPKAEAAAAK